MWDFLFLRYLVLNILIDDIIGFVYVCDFFEVVVEDLMCVLNVFVCDIFYILLIVWVLFIFICM